MYAVFIHCYQLFLYKDYHIYVFIVLHVLPDDLFITEPL